MVKKEINTCCWACHSLDVIMCENSDLGVIIMGDCSAH